MMALLVLGFRKLENFNDNKIIKYIFINFIIQYLTYKYYNFVIFFINYVNLIFYYIISFIIYNIYFQNIFLI